jgi:hypothetical protein
VWHNPVLEKHEAISVADAGYATVLPYIITMLYLFALLNCIRFPETWLPPAPVVTTRLARLSWGGISAAALPADVIPIAHDRRCLGRGRRYGVIRTRKDLIRVLN